MLQDGGVMTATATTADVVKDTTTQGFMKDVIEESKRQPVLVDFWAPWCGPCKQLTPVLEKAVKAAKGKVKLVKMNIDEHPAIPGQMGIQSIPAVIAFFNGQPVDGFMGALPESQVDRVSRAHHQRRGRRRGKRSAESGRCRARRRQRRRRRRDLCAVARRGQRQRAGARRPRALLCRDRRARAGQTDARPGARSQAQRRGGRRCARRARDRRAGEVGRTARRSGKEGAANPLDHQARFDLAVALNANGKRDDAVEHLIDIVKRDRKWNDDGARKQLVQFFEAWGPTDGDCGRPQAPVVDFVFVSFSPRWRHRVAE